MSALADWFRRLHRDEPALSSAGWAHIVFLFFMLIAAPWDSREVLGLNPWIKPMKFAVSIAIYLWTLGWLLRYLPALGRFKQAVRWCATAFMLVEIALISIQASRGVPSHFNVSTSADALMFAVMGILIFLNTFLVLGVFFQFLWQEIDLDAAYLLGIRLGLALFIFGSLQGMTMVLNMGHTVGAPDGGPGLVFFNWSTTNGDLRAAHAAGLHALQLLPLAGWLVGRFASSLPRTAQLLIVALLACAYLAAFAWLLRVAMAGQPLVR